MRQKMRLNLMRRLQLGFVRLQLEVADCDLPFQLAIPPFKPRPGLSRQKESHPGDQREKRAAFDIGPIS
jgi:hypothetical protein